MTGTMILLIISGIFMGALLSAVIVKKSMEARMTSTTNAAQKMIDEARKESETLKKEAMLQAKDSLYQMKVDFERETKDTRRELQNLERRLLQKDDNLEKKAELFDKRETSLGQKEKTLLHQEKELTEKQHSLDKIILEQRSQLERIAGIPSSEAKEMLIRSMEAEARHDAAKLIKKIETGARENAGKKSREIISLAIKRYAGDYVAEKAISVVTTDNIVFDVIPGSLQFTYYQSGSSTSFSPATQSDRDDIRVVGVQFQVHTQNEEPGYMGGYDLIAGNSGTCRIRSMATRVRVRNMGFKDIE